MRQPSCDVVVIGAGVIGLATALALAEQGRSVHVLDSGRVGGGSSHGNCGTLTPSHAPPLAAPGMALTALRMMASADSPLYIPPRFDPLLWRWLWRLNSRCNGRDWTQSARAKSALLNDSRARIQAWVGRFALDCDFVEAGEDYVFRDPSRFEHAQRELPLLRQLGVGVEVLDGEAYARDEPAVKPGMAGAIRFAGDAALRPDRYLAELARVAGEHGAAVDSERAVTAIAQSGRSCWRVATTAGDVEAANVVIAAGAWSSGVAALAGQGWLRRVMQPGKGYSITYDRPTLTPRRPLVLRERAVCVTAWPDGYRLGSTMEFSGYDTRMNSRRLAALERGAAEYLHVPVGPVARERWWGWRPMSVDDVPLIGPVPGTPGLWLATGHGMMGVGMSAGTGQLLADLITGAKPALDAAPYAPSRFRG